MLCGGRLPPDARELPSTVPSPLRRLVLRLLEPERNRRPASAAAVGAELSELTGELAPYPAGARLLAEQVAAVVPAGETDVSVRPTLIRSTVQLRKARA